jgi:serine/threonine protein kinase
MAVDRDRPGGVRSPASPVPAADEPLEPTTPLPASTAGLHPDPNTLELGAVVAGRFAITRFIARGGMGAVYEAEDTTLRTRVALKTILPEFAADPNAMERFRREVLLARRITHFNVCRIFELYDTIDPRGDRLSFLTMELLHGETLAERLARTGPLATAELSVLLRQLADGL